MKRKGNGKGKVENVAVKRRLKYFDNDYYYGPSVIFMIYVSFYI